MTTPGTRGSRGNLMKILGNILKELQEINKNLRFLRNIPRDEDYDDGYFEKNQGYINGGKSTFKK